jgi:hypothetical protein
MNMMRAVSSEGWGRLKFYKNIRQKLVEDRGFRAYFEKDTDKLPEFYTNLIKKDLGIWYEWLPEGAIYHDHKAYLHKTAKKAATVSMATSVQQ